MKRIFVALLVIPSFVAKSQTYKSPDIGFGATIGGATSKTFFLDLFYKKQTNRYHVGMSFQYNGQKGPSKRERLSNYGTTSTGTGNYFTVLDLKYSKILKEKFSLWGELSFGANKRYTNYRDSRFKSGGYHLIRESSAIAGAGVGVGYSIGNGFEIMVDYNTLRKVGFALTVTM